MLIWTRSNLSHWTLCVSLGNSVPSIGVPQGSGLFYTLHILVPFPGSMVFYSTVMLMTARSISLWKKADSSLIKPLLNSLDVLRRRWF